MKSHTPAQMIERLRRESDVFDRPRPGRTEREALFWVWLRKRLAAVSDHTPLPSLEDAAEVIAQATLWTPTEALAILKLSHLGVRAETVIAPWKDHV